MHHAQDIGPKRGCAAGGRNACVIGQKAVLSDRTTVDEMNPGVIQGETPLAVTPGREQDEKGYSNREKKNCGTTCVFFANIHLFRYSSPKL
jgi:hypothetical protein